MALFYFRALENRAMCVSAVRLFNSQLGAIAILGNHKKAQAKAMRLSKLRFSLSYRVAIALKCFNPANAFLTRWRYL